MNDFLIENLKRKEAYFTKMTIEQRSKMILKTTGQFLNRHRNIVYDINKAALFVLDMQDYFLAEKSHAYVPSSEAIIPGINKLICFFSEKNLPIFFSRHIDDTGNGMMRKWWDGTISKTDMLSKLTEKICLKRGKIIEKNYYDFFKDTELDKILKQKEIESIIITGVMTHLCCETTARSGFMNGYQIFFPVDGTATYNFSFHRATFVNLSHGFVIPTLVKELMD